MLPLAFLAGQRTAGLSWGGEIDSVQEGMVVYKYDLRLDVDLEAHRVDGTLGIRYQLAEGKTTLRLHVGPWFAVDAVTSGGAELSFSRGEGLLDISTTADSGWVYVSYGGVPPEAKNPPWSGGFSWEMDDEGNHWQGLSSQNAGGVLFMPCVNHPSMRALEGARLEISVPSPYVVAANGLLKAVQKRGDKTTYVWDSQYPISTYNINFTTGVFEREERPYVSVSGDTVPMVIYLLTSDVDRMDELFRVFRQSVKTQESYFGPYPFADEKLGLVQTSYLGMEHQTINAYGNGFRFDTLNGVVFDWLLHHELGHEWWGNKLSVPDWADFWLHEGFCTYGDWLARDAYGGREAYMKHVQKVKRSIPFIKPLVPERPADSKTAYHREVYFKGAYVLHSLRWILGEEIFFDLLLDIAKSNVYSYENQWTTDDFLKKLSEYTHYDLSDIMEVYLYKTEPIKLVLRAWPEDMYSIRWENISGPLPLEVELDGERHTLELGERAIFFTASSRPEIDPDSWYLLQVSEEE